jgi:hypothetical protein
VATLTYSYADFEVVLGPLSPSQQSGGYDLCRPHADGLRAPKGWEITRLAGDFDSTANSESDVMALADLIRRTGLGEQSAPAPQFSRRKRHLAVLADPN